MAITLRNKRLEHEIRDIGRHTGEGPSAVIASAVDAYRERIDADRRREYEERLARIRAFTATLPVATEEESEAIREEMDRMYDYLYEDEAK